MRPGRAAGSGSKSAVAVGRPVRVFDRYDPLWLKAPVILRRYPGALAAAVLAALILGVTTSAGRMFVSSAGAAALSREIEAASRGDAGLRVVAYGGLGPSDGASPSGSDILQARNAYIRAETAGLEGLGRPVLTIVGSDATIRAATGGGSSAPVVLLSRTGFLDHIARIAGDPTVDGVWIPASAAQATGLGPGEEVSIEVRGKVVNAPVAGVFEDLRTRRLTDYWSPVADFLFPENGPGEPLLANQALFAHIGAKLDEHDQFRWELPVVGQPSLDEAARLAAGLRAFEDRFDDPANTRAQTLFAEGTHGSELPEIVQRANRVVGTLRGPVATISLAGGSVALAVVAGIGLFVVRRRRAEMELLSTKGVSRQALGVRVGLETLAPIAVGAALGWLVARFLVGVAGPGGEIDVAAVRSSTYSVALTAGLGVVLVSVVAGASASGARTDEVDGRVRSGIARVPWEIVVLVLAAASYYEILTRGESVVPTRSASPRIDVLLMLFPLLFIGGMAGLAIKLLDRALARLRPPRARGRPARFLAVRRLRAASPLGFLLVTASSIGIGILMYSGVVTTSLEATTSAKARAETGSDVRVALLPDAQVTAVADVSSTLVDRVEAVTIQPTGLRATLLAVDRSTFARAAFWSSSYGMDTPAVFLHRLSPGGDVTRLRGAVVGTTLPRGASLDIGAVRIVITPVAELDGFPGASGPVLVVDRTGLERLLRVHRLSPAAAGVKLELWARGDPDRVLGALSDAGIPIANATTASEVAGSLAFVALTWIFGLLLALGMLASMVAIAGMLLYLQAMQRQRELSYALAARMGLGRGEHRLAVGLELGAMLAASYALGLAVAFPAAWLVVRRLDLLPLVSLPPIVRVPQLLLLLTLGALVMVCMLGAGLVQRAADRARVAEVLRLAV